MTLSGFDTITAGIDLPTWTCADVVETLGVEGRPITGQDFASRVDGLKIRALWNLRARARERMVEALRARGLSAADSDALWIGWAGCLRAESRPELLLRDLARLERLFDDPMNAVRWVVAGYPGGTQGATLRSQLVELAESARFDGRVVFVPEWEPEVARILVSGVDLWLTSAHREGGAGGMGGVMAAANGALNVSTPGGWWAQGAADERAAQGWTLGGPRSIDDRDGQDEYDARSLYELLEREVVPLFYDWDREGVPQRWLARVRASMRAIPLAFDGARAADS